jgi:acetyl-CoA C-acetyltransferase
MLAGGMEAMSKVPHYSYMRMPTPFGPGKLLDGIQADGLMDVYNNILMGSCVEKLCSEMNITREAQDAYAIQSYERTRAAQESGALDWEIIEVVQQTKKGDVSINQDEECKKFMPAKFGGLKPAFAKNGTITAANASKLNDGACAFVLMSEEEAKARGLTPLAKILGYDDFGIAPSKAVPKALKRAGLDLKDVDYHEVNEAFSAVALANSQMLDLDMSKVNVHGGAVALGHPLGMSGARIILSLINVLRKKDASIGMASICNGGGGASAIVIERMS